MCSIYEITIEAQACYRLKMLLTPNLRRQSTSDYLDADHHLDPERRRVLRPKHFFAAPVPVHCHQARALAGRQGSGRVNSTATD